MAYQSTLDDPVRDTNAFYRRTLHVLSDGHVPFLVGGSHAYLQYTGIVRNTKDFDLFIRRNDLDRALDALQDAGYRTEIMFPHWLAKAHFGEDFVDLIYRSGNGVSAVDDGWFANPVRCSEAKRKSPDRSPVKILPVRLPPWAAGASSCQRARIAGACPSRIPSNRAWTPSRIISGWVRT